MFPSRARILVPSVGVGKAWAKVTDAWSFSSMLAQGSFRTNFVWNMLIGLFHIGDRYDGLPKSTYAEFLTILACSFTSLFHGKWPSHDHLGNKYKANTTTGQRAGTWLAGGYRGILWQIKGDLDWFYQSLQLPRYNAAQPCSWCPCNHATDPWWHLAPAAHWFHNMYSAAQFRTLGIDKSHLFTIPAVTVHTLRCDLMHCKHIGVNQYFLASVLELIYTDFGISITDIHNGVRARYPRSIQHSSRFSNILVSTFRRRVGYPKLRGKASECKYLVWSLLPYFESVMDATSRMHRQIRMGLKCLKEFDILIDDNSHRIVYPESLTNQLLKTLWDFCAINTALRTHFHGMNRRLFAKTIKYHMLVHCAQQSRLGNPRSGWCYHGEDFMRNVKQLVQSSNRGRYSSIVCHKVMLKYKYLLFFESVPESSLILNVTRRE